jgi:GNAT superfamily N-acetyltransferase
MPRTRPGASVGPPLPTTFEDAANAGLPLDASQVASETRSRATTNLVRHVVVPRLVREAIDRGWWASLSEPTSTMRTVATPGVGAPAVLPRVEPHVWERLTLAHRVIQPVDPAAAHGLVLAAIRDGAGVAAALEGTTVVGLAITRHADDAARSDLLALGVAPAWRRRGLATGLLTARIESTRPVDVDHEALITVAERDPFEPIDVATRAAIARRLLTGTGFVVGPPGGVIGSADPTAIRASRRLLTD